MTSLVQYRCFFAKELQDLRRIKKFSLRMKLFLGRYQYYSCLLIELYCFVMKYTRWNEIRDLNVYIFVIEEMNRFDREKI